MKKPSDFKILIACEESQAICIEFRQLGFEAYSCDIQECSGGKPEWHIHGDAITEAYSGKYDLMIAHPPCTYLSKAGARWLYKGGEIQQERLNKGLQAKEFFYKMLNAPIKYIAVENPQPMKIFELPKHSQAIQPYEFGHPFSKKTLLWLKNLPPLMSTVIVGNFEPYLPSNTGGAKRGQKATFRNTTQKSRSKTFEGVAEAIATQWGLFLQ